MPKYRIMHIIGARPHFMKLAPIYHLGRRDVDIAQYIVHTGQHYDAELSQNFITEFALPAVDANLEVGSQRPLIQFAQILSGLDLEIANYQPDIIFVYGDTNSTAAGAIAAAKTQIPLAHIEAGLREHDKTIPEEINKLLTDAVADLYFCPTQTSVDQLAREGVSRHVYLTGDPVIDWIDMHATEKISVENLREFGVTPGDYIFMTCHRAANTDQRQNLTAIFKGIEERKLKTVLPLHPRTAHAIEKFDLKSILADANLIVTEPIGFWKTQALIKYAHAVLTDSGGVIKEAYYHRVPSVIVDRQTEWVEIVNDGWAVIAGPDDVAIQQALRSLKRPDAPPGPLAQPGAANRILEHTKHFLDA